MTHITQRGLIASGAAAITRAALPATANRDFMPRAALVRASGCCQFTTSATDRP